MRSRRPMRGSRPAAGPCERHAAQLPARHHHLGGRAARPLRLPAVLQLMHPIDWTIIGFYLVWIVWDVTRLAKRSRELAGYSLGGRSLPWWAVGLSVMATQL